MTREVENKYFQEDVKSVVNCVMYLGLTRSEDDFPRTLSSLGGQRTRPSDRTGDSTVDGLYSPLYEPENWCHSGHFTSEKSKQVI